MKFMIDGGSTAPLPKARKWLIKYPEASRELLELLKDKVVDYLVAQVKAGAQVRLENTEFENEPPRDKTNKMACAPSKDSTQPGHPPSLIRVFAVRSLGS